MTKKETRETEKAVHVQATRQVAWFVAQTRAQQRKGVR